MKILLDTQVWIWMQRANPALGEGAADPDRRSQRSRSLAATPWEIAIKVALGKLRLPCPVEEFVSTRSVATRVTPLPITQLHAIESAALPAHHRDPFDRVLIAQARIEMLRLVSTDDVFRSYDVDVLWAH